MWGVRLGPAPPELVRLQSEQSEMLESMASEASRHSTGPLGSIGNVSEPDSSWEARDGRALPQVEADQEQYLDAIRQDLGTTSVLTLASGKVLNAEGQNYKQPRLKYMSRDFERGYWLRKPEVDQHIGASHSRPLDRSFENIKRTPSPQRSKQTEEWVNGIVDFQKPVYSGRAPWITDGMKLLNTRVNRQLACKTLTPRVRLEISTVQHATFEVDADDEDLTYNACRRLQTLISLFPPPRLFSTLA